MQDNLGILCFNFTTHLIGGTEVEPVVPAVALAITAEVAVTGAEGVVTTADTQHRSTHLPFRACPHQGPSGTPTSQTVKCLSPTELEVTSGVTVAEVITTTSTEVAVVAMVPLVPSTAATRVSQTALTRITASGASQVAIRRSNNHKQANSSNRQGRQARRPPLQAHLQTEVAPVEVAVVAIRSSDDHMSLVRLLQKRTSKVLALPYLIAKNWSHEETDVTSNSTLSSRFLSSKYVKAQLTSSHPHTEPCFYPLLLLHLLFDLRP